MAEQTWETLRFNNNYEICTEYPHQIRKKSNHRIIAEHENNCGYILVTITGNSELKHRLIAYQWIENPDNLPEINHKDHNKTNNHIENLEWCTVSTNRSDRLPYQQQQFEYLDEIPDTAIELDSYNGHEYNKYWYDYDSERVIINTRNKFRFVNSSWRTNSVNLIDIHGHQHMISLNKLQKEMTDRLNLEL